MIDHLPRGRTVYAEYDGNLSCRLKDELKENRRAKPAGTCSLLAGQWVFSQDFMFEDFEVWLHPPHSPNLALSDYFLFSNLKKKKKRQRPVMKAFFRRITKSKLSILIDFFPHTPTLCFQVGMRFMISSSWSLPPYTPPSLLLKDLYCIRC